MPERETSNPGKHSTRITPLQNLTKRQLVELLQGNIERPIAPHGLYRCATSVVTKWCDDVIEGRYASTVDLSNKLETLRDIYRNR